jgi:hypothetical protein
LVWIEDFADVPAAIAREKQVKRWRREKKITLIERENPTWEDLSEEWGKPYEFYQELGCRKKKQVSPLRFAPVEMTKFGDKLVGGSLRLG